jgi:F-box and leucine-rich repeat protein 2/20
MPQSLLLRLTRIGGPFTTTLDVAGHVPLTASTLLRMTHNLCLTAPQSASLPYTQLTAINLSGCSSLTTRSLHHLLVRSRSLQKLCLRGLRAVTNTTCDILSTYNPRLVCLDMGRCSNMDAEGIEHLAVAAINRGEHLRFRELRLCGLNKIDDRMMATLGKAAPYLEVLDLSYARQLHNTALDAFVACEDSAEELGIETIWVSARDLGRDSTVKLRRRVTGLRHLSVSSCIMLTDDACSNLTFSVPKLEFFEMAGIGSELKDDGLIRFLNTTPFIRRLDLEDAPELSDALLAAITPAVDRPPQECAEPEPGYALEQLNISYAAQVTDDALLSLVRRCPRLACLGVDNTRVGGAVLAEFVRLNRKRKTADAKIIAVDCRNVSAGLVQDLSASTRPRKGWRAHEARKLFFLDARDGNTDELKIGQDECDESRVVLKSFYSWQTVDAVKAARDRRRKSSRRKANDSASDVDDVGGGSGRSTRWWSPGGRRTPRSGSNSPPNMMDMSNEGCTVM